MHYKNGREANEGDPVICKGYNGKVTVGKIHTLTAGSGTCNCTVAEPVMGGVTQLTCQTVGLLYHAEDGFAALESNNIKQVAEAAPKPVEQAATGPAAN